MTLLEPIQIVSLAYGVIGFMIGGLAVFFGSIFIKKNNSYPMNPNVCSSINLGGG